jgi:hypothetical protein
VVGDVSWGLRCSVPIQKGQVVLELSGELLDEDALIQRADKRFVASLDAAAAHRGASSRTQQQSVRIPHHARQTAQHTRHVLARTPHRTCQHVIRIGPVLTSADIGVTPPHTSLSTTAEHPLVTWTVPRAPLRLPPSA